MSGDRLVERGASLLEDLSQRARAQGGFVSKLAAAEVQRKVKALGVGIGLSAGAALFALFALGFTLAGIAAALALAVPTWAAILIVAAGALLLAAGLGAAAMSFFKKGAPPIPE